MTKKFKGCLYKISTPSGKSYIGITKNTAEKRFKQHQKSIMPIGDAIRKYGDKVTLETLVISDSWEYLKELEIKAIAIFDTFSQNGYNCTKGGEGCLGFIFTKELKDKHSVIQKISLNRPEVRAKMSASAKLAKDTPESKIKNSIVQKLVKNTPEAKARNRKAQKAAWNNPEIRAKHMMTRSTPELKEKQSAAQKIAQNLPETKAKIIATNALAEVKERRNEAQKNVQNKPEVKEKHSIATKLKWQDEEFRKKQAETRKLLMTDEFREKLSLAHKGKPWSESRRQAQIKRSNHD